MHYYGAAINFKNKKSHHFNAELLRKDDLIVW